MNIYIYLLIITLCIILLSIPIIFIGYENEKKDKHIKNHDKNEE